MSPQIEYICKELLNEWMDKPIGFSLPCGRFIDLAEYGLGLRLEREINYNRNLGIDWKELHIFVAEYLNKV